MEIGTGLRVQTGKVYAMFNSPGYVGLFPKAKQVHRLKFFFSKIAYDYVMEYKGDNYSQSTRQRQAIAG